MKQETRRMSRMKQRLVLGIGAMLVLVPFPGEACGQCIDRVIRFNCPFAPWWAILFLVWFLARLFAGPDAHKTSTGKKVLNLLGGVVFTLALSFLSLGSLLFPFFWYFWWWMVRVLREGFGAETLPHPRWRVVSRLGLLLLMGMVAWGYTVSRADPVWVGGFIDYHGGPVIPARERMVQMGFPAVPIIIERLLNENRLPSFKEKDWQAGISLIEAISSQTFKADPLLDTMPDGSFDELAIRRRKLLEWWGKYSSTPQH